MTGCSQQQLYASQRLTEVAEFEDVLAEPDMHQAQVFTWSGLIAKVDNLAQQTRLEVLFLPLDRQGQPRQHETSPGRFVVYVTPFLDPLLYSKGRSVTVTGSLQAIAPFKVDQRLRMMPVLQAHIQPMEKLNETIKLWPIQRNITIHCEEYRVGSRSRSYLEASSRCDCW